MQQGHKGGLLMKVTSGKASKEETAELLVMYQCLTKQKPPMGDAESWKKKTEALVAGAKLVMGVECRSGELKHHDNKEIFHEEGPGTKGDDLLCISCCLDLFEYCPTDRTEFHPTLGIFLCDWMGPQDLAFGVARLVLVCKLTHPLENLWLVRAIVRNHADRQAVGARIGKYADQKQAWGQIQV
jgi:hypothetical protein